MLVFWKVYHAPNVSVVLNNLEMFNFQTVVPSIFEYIGGNEKK